METEVQPLMSPANKKWRILDCPELDSHMGSNDMDACEEMRVWQQMKETSRNVNLKLVCLQLYVDKK